MDNTMKDSGIECVGFIPNNWDCKRLKYLLKTPLQYGANEAGDDFDDVNPRYIRITDITEDGELKNDGKQSIQIKLAKPYLLKEGNVLFARSGATVGKTFYYTKENGIAAFAGYLIKADVDEKLLQSKFLYYITLGCGYENWKNSIFSQATIQNIGADKYANLPIPLPPVEEQVLIIDHLDKKCSEIDGIISKIEKQIEKLNDYKKSLIHECVTKGLNKNVEFKESGVNWIGHIPESWSVNKIKYLATEKDTIFIDGDWIESDVICDEGIRYLTTGNVGVGFFKVQGDSYISQKTFNNLHCLNVVPGDLMISRLNEPIARACLVPDDEDRYVVAVDNVILRPNSDIDKKYLMYVMNSDGYSSLANITARGSTMSRISRTQLGQFFVPIPTYDEQKLIANYLDRQCEKINAIISKKQKQLLDIKQYKSSLIYEYVTGKKRVKVGE